MLIIKKINNFYEQLLLIIIYIFFSIPNSPFFLKLGYDREIFQYIGFIIKENLSPYLNVFDHKPPLIYIINYLGLVISSNNTWGVYIIINIIGYFSSYLIFKIAYSKFKKIQYPLLLFIFYVSLCNVNNILQGGNLTRQLTLFFTVILFYIILNNKRKSIDYFISGIIYSLIFFTQQNEVIGLSIIIIYYIFFNETFLLLKLQTLKRNILFFSSGFLLVTFVLLILLLKVWNNFYEFIDQAFLFNFTNHINNAPFFTKVINCLHEFYLLIKSNRTFLLIIIFIVLNIFLLNKKNNSKKLIILLLLIIGFILQIVSTSLSGKVFHHYYLMFIPFLILLFLFSLNIKNKKYNMIIFTILILSEIYNIKNMNFMKKQDLLFEQVIKKVAIEKNNEGQFYTFNAKYLRVNYNLNIVSPSKWVYTHFENMDFKSKELITDFKKFKTKFILFNEYKSNPTAELISYLKENYKIDLKTKDYILYKRIEVND